MWKIQRVGVLLVSLLFSAVMLCLPAYAAGEPASITVGETTTPYATVQAAINAAADGQTVNVLASVTENLTISKAITLKGQGRDTTIISGTIDIDQSTMTSGAVKIEGMTIGGTAAGTQLVKITNTRSNIPITLQGNKFAIENLASSGKAVLVDATSYQVTLTSNIVASNSNSIHSVLHIQGVSSSDSQITISNNNFPVSVTAAALSNLQGAVSVTGNALTGAGTGIGVDVIETAGRPVTITGNLTISNFNTGIRSKLAETTRAISNNAFAGNSAAISVDTTAVSGTINLTGNSFNNGNTANIVKTNSGGARIVRLVSSGQSLAAAIAAAESGDTINVAPGTFADSLTIDKSIKLVGSNQASVVSGTVTANVPGIVVEISGFSFTGSNVNISSAAKAVLANNKFPGAALQLSGVADVSITDSTFPSAGIQVTGATKAEILRNTFSAPVTNAIELGGTTGNSTIQGNSITGAATGINYHPQANASVTIRKNKIENTTSAALRLNIPEGSGTNTIELNEVIIASGYAVYNASAKPVTVAKNYWGSAAPSFSTIMNPNTASIVYLPFYKDASFGESHLVTNQVLNEVVQAIAANNYINARNNLVALPLTELIKPEYKNVLSQLDILYNTANSNKFTVNSAGYSPITAFSISGAALSLEQADTPTAMVIRNDTDNRSTPSGYRLSNVKMQITFSKSLKAPVTITMPIPAGLSTSDLVVVHYKYNNTTELLTPTITGSNLSFTTTSFSTFVFANRVSSSGGGNDSTNEAFNFWSDVEDEILDAKSGDKIEVDARGVDRVSAFVLNTLKGKNVTLVITTDEGKVTINGKTMKAVDKGQLYYTPAEFVKHFKTAAASSSSQSASTSWKPPVSSSSSTSVSQSVSSSESSEEPSSSSNSEVDVVTQPEEPTPERNTNKEILLWGSIAAGVLAIIIIAVVISYHLGTKSKRF